MLCSLDGSSGQKHNVGMTSWTLINNNSYRRMNTALKPSYEAYSSIYLFLDYVFAKWQHLTDIIVLCNT